jgi:hypothetical protein
MVTTPNPKPTPNPKSHPKGKTTNLKKPPPKPPPNSETLTWPQKNTTRNTMSQENTTRTTRQNSNTIYKTFDGTTRDEKGMLRNAIHAITSTTRNPFVKRLTSTNMRKKMNQRLMNEDRTAEELRHDLERITEPKHVQRNATNPPSLRYSTEFLKAFDVPNNITDVNNPKITDANSPNLLDDHNYDSEETELGPETTSETPITSNTTPYDTLTQQNETTALNDLKQENEEEQEPGEEQYLDDDSLATNYQTTTQDFERTLERATKNLTDIDQEEHIRQLLLKVISEERHKSIKTAIQQELVSALNDEEMDLQQTEISTTLGQRITTAEAIEKLLDKRITKARNNYESIKNHQKELEEKNDALALEVQRVDQLIIQTQELARKVWEKHEQHINQAETKHRKIFDDMLERAKLQGLATMEKKYQDKIKHVNKQMGNTHRIDCQNTTHEYEKKLNVAYEKHRASMNEQITDMNDMAESLVEQAPMSVASEIEVAKEDAIAELQAAIQDTKDKALAQWNTTTVIQNMMHGFESKIDRTMDTILDKRKTEFQTVQQEMEKLIERRRTEFESHVEVFINNETGNHDDSTLQQALTIAVTEAAEQMSHTKEAAKKEVDDYIAMRKQELETEIGEFQHDIANSKTRHDHMQTPMSTHSSHTDHQDTTQDAPPSWQHQVLLNRNSLQVTSNIPRFRRETIQHNLTNEPRQDQLESFYDSLVTTMDSYEMPILRRQELQPRGTTVPLQSAVHDEILLKISRILFGKLLETIPEECVALREVLDSYASEQDGYSALYSIMRTKCRYLQDLLPSWGPTWKQDTGAYQYLAELKSYLDEARRSHKQYSEFEVAAEILQQSKEHSDYNLIATAYLTRLTSYTTTRTNLPAEFRMNNLVNTLATNRSQHTPTIPQSPTINRFGEGSGKFGTNNSNQNGNGNRNGQRSPFKYRNEVQCEACKTYGHCIGDNVCRIAAQVHHVNAYKDKAPDNAKKNASAFATANNKAKINLVKTNFPDTFHEDMTEEEEEYTICQMARMMQPDSDTE